MGKLGNTRVVVKNWRPSKLDSETIEREFKELAVQLMKDLTDRETVTALTRGTPDVRGPAAQFVSPKMHSDCNGRDQYLLCWSNVLPTIVRYPNGDWLKANDGDVILINNREVKHNAPASRETMEKAGRWFARLRLTPTGRFKLHN